MAFAQGSLVTSSQDLCHWHAAVHAKDRGAATQPGEAASELDRAHTWLVAGEL